jgi:hypothetical protein
MVYARSKPLVAKAMLPSPWAKGKCGCDIVLKRHIF